MNVDQSGIRLHGTLWRVASRFFATQALLRHGVGLLAWGLLMPAWLEAGSGGQDFQVTRITASAGPLLSIEYQSDPNAYFILFQGESVTGITNTVAINTGVDDDSAFVVTPRSFSQFYRVQRVPVSDPLDYDKDGMDDLYEHQHDFFLNPFDPTDGRLDFDMDRIPNVEEYFLGQDPAVSRRDINIESLEIFHVGFDKPVRVGYGTEARFYREALEFRLRVPPQATGNQEPFLYVGTTELRGHKTLAAGDHLILAFYAYNPTALVENACVFLTTDRRAGRRPAHAVCKYRFTTNAIQPGVPLETKTQLDPALLGPPPTEPWAGPELYQPPPVSGGAADFSDVRFQWHDPQGRPVRRIQPGDSLSMSFTGLPQRRQIQLQLIDDQGQEWSYARLSADRSGRIARTVVWFNTGVIGTTTRNIRSRPELSFMTFDEAYDYWSRHSLRLLLKTDEGLPLASVPVPLETVRQSPMLYPSTRDGVLMNAVEAGREPLFVTGTHFAPGSKIMLFTVPNRYGWDPGTPLHDVTGPGFDQAVKAIQLGPKDTSFTVAVWEAARPRPGAYDFVARVVPDFPDADDLTYAVEDTDVVSFGDDTGVIVYDLTDGHIEMEIAGREIPAYAYFEFADVFERHEAVYGAVDPTDFPADHPGGHYAAYYVVAQRTSGYWSGAAPALVDVSGPGGSSQIEIAQVKYGCINQSVRTIWPDPDPQQMPGEYDVVVDFGLIAAQESTDYLADGTYDVGVDFIDGYNKVGFCVVDDPATPGPFPVGKADHYDANFNGGANDPFDFNELGFPMVRNWFTIRYPAQATGVEQPLPAGNAQYPLVLFLHGRHRTCTCGDCDTSYECYYNLNCAPAERVASHRGYNYILDTLASQGFIAISIDAFDIQPSNEQYNIEARARLILEHLNRIKAWHNNGSDPWGALNFQGRIDLNHIAIVGHSRGGEAVQAAAHINATEWLTYGHQIEAVVALAPTDGEAGAPWTMTTAPMLVLLGAADGDVWDLAGVRTYDRAYGAEASPQFAKALGFINGANHVFFNTVWTPGFPGADPCATDDALQEGYDGPLITDTEQRQIALSSVAGFIHWHLKGFEKYREIFTGRLELQSMNNEVILWSYQDPNRMTVEDFETGPPGMNKNSLNGQYAMDPLFLTQAEADLSDYSYHETIGLELAWDTGGLEYENNLPVAHRDLSVWTHLSFRVMQIDDELNPLDSGKTLRLTLVDGNDNTRVVYSNDFETIPFPYLQYQSQYATTRVCQMKSVRLPLRAFTLNNSGVDLSDIHKIILRVQGTGRIGIDDLQITR